MLPPATPHWRHAMNTDHRWMAVVVPVRLTGLPALTIPIGFGARGLPMGLPISGRMGADADVLALGRCWHDATDRPGRRPPDAHGGEGLAGTGALG